MSQAAAKEICPECGLEMPAGMGCPGCSLRLALSPASPAPFAPTPPPPGLKSRFFGSYEILEEVARGGMGIVYKARQLGLNRLVALKMVQSSHLLSDEARLRFRVEIEAVAQLSHPHIVSLYESGDQDGIHYFTMRLVEGGDLSAHLKERKPIRERVQLLVKVCRAVHYAHQRGILHRDLKPSNILVDTDGEPQVADFGLAKSIDHDSGFTFTSSVLGSPNYMAPEQATGQTRQFTTAVDVYGLGAILYHMLSGRPPFQARTPIETLRMVVDHAPAAPRSIDPEADRDLETIALKCLQKEPAARYGSAEELARDLERWVAGEPILARPLGPLTAAWRWSRRHPAVALLGIALALALAAIVAGTGIAAVRIRQADQKADAHLRDSLLREASSLRLGSELGNRDAAMSLIREAAGLGGPPEFRIKARNELLATMARTEPRFLPFGTNANAARDLSGVRPGFQMMGSVEDETNVVFHGVDDLGYRGRLVSPFGPVTLVDTFSPSGMFLVLRHTNSWSVWDLKSDEPVLARPGTNAVFAFHPREEAILIQVSPNQAALFDLPGGNVKLGWKALPGRPGGRQAGWHSLAMSPDGGLVAGASPGSTSVELMDPTNGNQLQVITSGSRTAAIGWSPDGTSLAIGTADARVTIWNPANGTLKWSSPTMVAPAASLAFHPHREWLAVGCTDAKVRFIDTRQQRFVFESPVESRRLTFSPHGIRLGPVWSDGRLGWLETRRSAAFVSFGAGASPDRLTDAAFNADGTVLAIGDPGAVVLCNPRLGRTAGMKPNWRMPACNFHPVENDLLVADRTGISRYRYSLVGARTSLSTPELVLPGANWTAFTFTPDARRFAAFNNRSNLVYVFDETLTNRVAWMGPHAGTESVALEPGGRWVATGGSRDRLVRIWDVSTGREVKRVPGGYQPRSTFSRDGKWLAVAGERLHLLETETWRAGPALATSEGNAILRAAAFSPDSRMLAVVVNKFEVHLFDLRTFAPLGILRPPGTMEMLALVFSPDGGQLAAVGTESRVGVWNMKEVEEALREFGLGWLNR